MDRPTAVSALAGLRTAVGVASWVTPRTSGRLFGIDPGRNDQAPYLARLFGARDAGLAYGAYSTSGAEQDRWLVVGLACDAADAAAGIAGHRGGYLDPVTSFLVTGTAIAACALGAVALRSKPELAP
jgi:hypothetical protein